MSEPAKEIGPDTVLLVRTGEPARLPTAEGEWVELEEEPSIEMWSVRLNDGLNALPAFTSQDELSEWAPEGAPYVGMRAAELLPMAFESGYDLVLVNAWNTERKGFVIRRENFPPSG